MKNITQITCLLLIIALQACSFKIGIKKRYFTNEELKKYAIDNNYPFDYLLKFKNTAFFESRRESSINSLNFMNLYSKNNALLKSSNGDNCEFKIASFIKDSMTHLAENPIDQFSLGNLCAKSDIIKISNSPEILSDSNYKILIGWSINLNHYGIVRKRLEKLFEQLNTKDQKYVIIGLNLDPI